MVDTTRIAKLQYEITPKGFDALDKGFAQLNRNQEAARTRGQALANAYKQTSVAASEMASSRAIVQAQRDWDKALISAEKYTHELEKADRVTKQIAASTKTIKPVKPQTADDRFGEVSRNVGLFGDAETALRTVGVGGVVPEIFAVAEALPRLKVALEGLPEQAQLAAQALGVGGLGLGIALAGLAGAVLLLSKASQDARDAVQKRAEAEQAFNRLILSETQATIDKKLEAARFDVELATLNQKTAKEARDAAYDAYLASTNIFDTNRLFEAYAQADAVFQGSIKSTEDAQKAEENLLTARQNSLVVTRTATEAAVANAQAFLEEANAFSKFVSDTDISARVGALSGTSESIKQNIAALKLEREERQKAIDAGILSADTIKEYEKRILELSATISSQGNVLPTVILRELQAAYEEHGAALIKIDDDLFTKQAEARKTRDDATSEAERSAGIDRAENARKANLSLEEEQERHEKALGKIQRDFNAARTSAIQDRDVLALQAAKDARRESLRNENDANKERKDKINDALNEQNRAIDMKLAEQKRVIEKRFNEQLTSAQNAANKALEIENAKNAAILAATQTGADQLLAKHQAFWAAANAAPMQGASALPDTPGTPGTQSARSLLDNVPLTPIPSGNRGGGGGGGSALSIMFNLGARGRQIELKSREAALRALDNVLKEAGW